MSGEGPYAHVVSRRLGDRYVVGERIDEGGMGAVFRAEDTERGDIVAIKVLHPDLARETRHIARFFREAEAAMALQHPHIVETRSICGPGDEICWFAMELLEGASLHQRQERGQLFTPSEVIRIGRQILSALTAAHGIGVLHRDLKPGNVMLLDGRGRTLAKLVDFGIAVFTSSETYTRLTATGMVLGTPAYMPPEQVCGDALDERTDIYSLAATLHTILVGEPPFGRGTWGDILPRILTGARQTLHQRGVDRALAQVIETGLATDPEARWASAREMEVALGALDASDVGTIMQWQKPVAIQSIRLGPFDDTGPGFAPTMNIGLQGAFPATRETPSSKPPPMAPVIRPAPSSRPPLPDPAPIHAHPGDEIRLPTQKRGAVFAAAFALCLVLGVGVIWALGDDDVQRLPTPTGEVALPSRGAAIPATAPIPAGVEAPEATPRRESEAATEEVEEDGEASADVARAPRRTRSMRTIASGAAAGATGDPAEWKEREEGEADEEEAASASPASMTVATIPAPSVRTGGQAPIMVNVVSGGGMAVTAVAPGATPSVEETPGTHGPMVQIRTHRR